MEGWVARLTVIALTITVMGTGIAWLDARHASSSEVYELKSSIDRERLERIEFEIEELEREARRLKSRPAEELDTPEIRARMLELQSRRDRYLRKREELILEMQR
jgi:hypothetical protein